LIPGSISDPITNSKLLKDFEHLIDLKSGRLVNWNQQTLTALENDLGITPPRHVAPRLSTARPVLEAQTIEGAQAGVPTIQPAPVPEPSTLIFFATVLGGVILRSRFVRRRTTRA
jgi:hypothetical protein